jgi:hypothetical protein
MKLMVRSNTYKIIKIKNNMTLEQLLGLIRHIATIVGTFMMISGKMDPMNWEVITGAVLSTVALIWSFTSKSKPTA